MLFIRFKAEIALFLELSMSKQRGESWKKYGRLFVHQIVFPSTQKEGKKRKAQVIFSARKEKEMYGVIRARCLFFPFFTPVNVLLAVQKT